MIKYMVKYCMLKTRAVTAPSVAEQILMYSDGQTYVTECVLRSAYLFCASVCPRCVLWYCSSLRQGFQDGIHLLSYCCQRKFKLVLGANEARSLVSDVLQCSCNVNLFHSFGHAVQHHVNEDVCASSASAITAVNDDWAGTTSVAFIHLPAEVEQRPCRGGDAVSRPAQQVKLRQGSGLLRLNVLQIEATHQEVLTPDML